MFKCPHVREQYRMVCKSCLDEWEKRIAELEAELAAANERIRKLCAIVDNYGNRAAELASECVELKKQLAAARQPSAAVPAEQAPPPRRPGADGHHTGE